MFDGLDSFQIDCRWGELEVSVVLFFTLEKCLKVRVFPHQIIDDRRDRTTLNNHRLMMRFALPEISGCNKFSHILM